RPFAFFLFLKPPSPTEIYTPSLHDALPILECDLAIAALAAEAAVARDDQALGRDVLQRLPDLTGDIFRPIRLKHAMTDSADADLDRKSTRLNSSHLVISYAVFCLKKKK